MANHKERHVGISSICIVDDGSDGSRTAVSAPALPDAWDICPIFAAAAGGKTGLTPGQDSTGVCGYWPISPCSMANRLAPVRVDTPSLD
jgi:hypothetical protein